MSTITAEDVYCSATSVDEYNYSSDWGNFLVENWIRTRYLLRTGNVTAGGFRATLFDGVADKLDLRQAFLDACEVMGIEGDLNSNLFDDYEKLHRSESELLPIIPSGLHAELCWVPGWDEASLDDMHYAFGLKSAHGRSNYIDDVLPGKWLEVFLQLVNCGSVELIGEAINLYGDAGRAFARQCAKAQFYISKDQNRPQLLTAAEVLSVIENAYPGAVPMVHCEINVRQLYQMDPAKAWRMTTKHGKVHVGFHEGVFSGAGYMDTYKGSIVVPGDATGFIAASRLRYDIGDTYGLCKSMLRVTPEVLASVN